MCIFNTFGSFYCLQKQYSAYISNHSACIINVGGYTEIFPKELRPHVVATCRPCERRLNNFRAFKAMITYKEANGRKEWKGALKCHHRRHELWRARKMELLAAAWISSLVPKIKTWAYLQLNGRYEKENKQSGTACGLLLFLLSIMQ